MATPIPRFRTPAPTPRQPAFASGVKIPDPAPDQAAIAEKPAFLGVKKKPPPPKPLWIAALRTAQVPQVSRLRLINTGTETAEVSIRGFDDTGTSYGLVELSVPGESVRMLSAEELEAGGSGFTGALGDGVGKWQLVVRSESPLHVMSLLESPTGHLTNLSTSRGVLRDEPAPTP